MSFLHCFLSSAISSAMFSFLVSSSATLLQVFFGLPTGLLPSSTFCTTQGTKRIDFDNWEWVNIQKMLLSCKVFVRHCLVSLIGRVPVYCAGGLGLIPGQTNTQGLKIIEEQVGSGLYPSSAWHSYESGLGSQKEHKM